MTTIIFLVVVFIITYRAMTPEARVRAVKSVPAVIKRLNDYGRRELEPFRQSLRARTPWAIAVPAIILVHTVLLLGTRGAASPATLVAWGASYGPRTTNGEWWRLVTATFVSNGPVAFLICAAAMLQIGLMLERLTGPLILLAVYFASSLCAGIAVIATHPTLAASSAPYAVCGVYGLLIVAFTAGLLHESELRIPVVALERFAPISAVFLLYALVADSVVLVPALLALGVGIAFGIAAAAHGGAREPAPRRVLIAAGITVGVVAVSAVPLRGITDVRPEIQRVVALEHQTTGRYEAAARGAKAGGGATAEALAHVIERSVVPELEAADARMAGLQHVPPENQQQVADARTFLRVRRESWLLQAEALRRNSAHGPLNAALTPEASRAQAETRYRAAMMSRGKAEAASREAMKAFERIAQ